MKTLLALDGNSVLHRSFHAGARTGYRTPDGRPGWAVRGLLEQLVAAADRAQADAVVIGFDDPNVSVRRERWPDYKAHRPEKPDTLVDQLADAAALLADMGLPVVIPPGLEADDVLAAASRAATAAGWRSVLATSDRDAFALIDESTRVLRLINGGVDASPMLTPQRLKLLTGVTPEQYRDLAALRGDPSDNLPGVRGIGKVVGAKLLAEFGTAEALFDDLASGGERCRACAGPALTGRLATGHARQRWEFNRQLMTPHPNATVAAQVFETLIPLPPDPIRRGFRAYGLTTRTALTVLCGETPPTPTPDNPIPHDPISRDPSPGDHDLRDPSPGHPSPGDHDPGWPPTSRLVRRFPPLPSPAPVLQETLF